MIEHPAARDAAQVGCGVCAGTRLVRERVMTIHRRPGAEIDAVDAMYDKHYGAGKLAYDLNVRLEGLQRMQMTQLRMGNVAQADACAIEDKRRAIERLNEQGKSAKSLTGSLAFGALASYDYLAEHRRKQKEELSGDIQAIIELNKREALADSANAGRSAGEAVAERLDKIVSRQHGEAGNTLGSELTRTLGTDRGAAITAVTDPWNSVGSSNLVNSAAEQLAAREKAGTTSAKKIMDTLRSFRELAAHDLSGRLPRIRCDPDVGQARLRAARPPAARGGPTPSSPILRCARIRVPADRLNRVICLANGRADFAIHPHRRDGRLRV